jgi:hypothetical protein
MFPASRVVFSLLCVFALVGCEEDLNSIVLPPRPVDQTQTELDFVRQTFNRIQPASILGNREYCGYIGISDLGRYLATDPAAGDTSSCVADWPEIDGFTVLASYHTHGSWLADYDNEVPSFQDMATDIRERVDGYVATPGGRLWYIDAANRVAREVCGRNCLKSDPAFQVSNDGPPDPFYTLWELRRR